MRALFALQVALGIVKVAMAFSARSRYEMVRHLSSGVVIIALGLVLLTQRFP